MTKSVADASLPAIAVVMSTYNGEKYLAEQLDSVLAQDVTQMASLTVYVRDDGSKDSTISILKSYEQRGEIKLIEGENVGVVASFLDGMARVPHDVDYIALCDQDDIWHTDKLSRALSILQAKDNSVPQLYCSEYYFCDEQMHRQEKSKLNRIGVSFPTMLFENVVSGNTMVFNRVLADAVISAGPEGVYCHDWWIALVASALGEITYDDDATLEYRRTGSNASPTGSGFIKLMRYRIKTFLKSEGLNHIVLQLNKLGSEFGNQMGYEQYALLMVMLDKCCQYRVCMKCRFRQKISEEIFLRCMILLKFI